MDLDALLQATEDEGTPIREKQEAEILRAMRRAAVVTGAVGALVAGRYHGEEGLQIFVRICAEHIAADEELFRSLQVGTASPDEVTRPIVEELLGLASQIRGRV